jgi:transposase
MEFFRLLGHMRIARIIELSEDQKAQLQQIVRTRCASVRTVERVRIILLADEGQQDIDIAKELGVTRQKAARWRNRFLDCGIDALYQDAPRSGRKKQCSRQKITMIVQKTLKETPSNATHWSTRSMAKATGISAASVRRIWKAHGLKPHLIRTFKLSNDKAFEEKLEDIVGLYMNPPEHALVISCDEKSQIQALDRTQPGLPLKKGRAGTMTHDYVRNGTTTLFAALNTLDGTVMAMHQQKHRHQEWLKFLQMIDEQTPDDKQLHLIVDNYATHKHPRVQRWLLRHPRFHIHFTPTSASWLNAVERFFRDITVNRIRRGVFRNVEELEQAITDYIGHHNAAPKPFIWTASAGDILEKVKRARKNLDTLQDL